MEEAGLTVDVSTQLATLIQAALTPPSTTAPPLSQEDINALISELQAEGFTLPSGITANSPDLLKALLNEVEFNTVSAQLDALTQEITNLFIAEGLLTESIFNGAIQAGASLGDAVQAALNAALTTAALSVIFQTSNLGPTASDELSELLQASLTPSLLVALGGEAAFNKIVADLAAAGFNVPTNVDPNSPEFIRQLFDAIQAITPPANSAALTTLIFGILTSLNLPQTSIQSFVAAVASGTSLGEAINATFAEVPGDLINSLNINLNALPPDVLTAIENQVGTILSGIPNLTLDQITALAIAIGVAGFISPDQATAIIIALAALQTQGATPSTIGLFISAFQPPKGAEVDTGDPNETRQLSTMPQDLVQLFKDTFANLVVNKDDLQHLTSVVTTFADTVVTQKDFYQFSLDFLLGMIDTILKNFYSRTAETGSQGLAQTPTQIPV